MTSIGRKIGIVILAEVLKKSYLEDLENEIFQSIQIEDVPYRFSVLWNKHQNYVYLEFLTKSGNKIYSSFAYYDTTVRKEGFYPLNDRVLNGYIECFLSHVKYEEEELKKEYMTKPIERYFEKEYEKVQYLLEKKMGRIIGQRKIDFPNEVFYNQEGIECCAVLNECLQRMYFESASFLKVRKKVHIENWVVQDVYLFLTETLFNLIGEINDVSMGFLQSIQEQLNSCSEGEINENKLEYLVFLSTCLNEMVTQSLNETGSVHKQVEYTYKKEIEKLIIFIMNDYLQIKLPLNEINIEEVLKTFYRNEESEKMRNGNVLQKISRIFRKMS